MTIGRSCLLRAPPCYCFRSNPARAAVVAVPATAAPAGRFTQPRKERSTTTSCTQQPQGKRDVDSGRLYKDPDAVSTKLKFLGFWRFRIIFVNSAPNEFQTGRRAGCGSLYKRPERDSEQLAVPRDHHSDPCSYGRGWREKQTVLVTM
jgi:hypothetical protein